jgi:ketosteroid isomerase-like protein
MNKWLLQLTPLLMVALASIAPTQAVSSEPETEMVRKAVKMFAEVWNRHDMPALGALFAPDADFVNVTGQWWKGREQIQLRHAYLHGTVPADAVSADSVPAAFLRNHGIFKNSNYSFDTIEVRFITPDIAVTHGTWTMNADARTDEPRHGMMTFVLQRANDHWSYSAVQNTEINRRVNSN